MPSRIARDSARTSPTLDQLSHGAERLFWRLILSVDDHGRFHGDPGVVLAATFPLRIGRLRISTVRAWLDELGRVEAIRFYEVGGRSYLYLPSWSRHQRRPQGRSKFPEPPSEQDASTVPAPSPDGEATMNRVPSGFVRSRITQSSSRSRESGVRGAGEGGTTTPTLPGESEDEDFTTLSPAERARLLIDSRIIAENSRNPRPVRERAAQRVKRLEAMA